MGGIVLVAATVDEGGELAGRRAKGPEESREGKNGAQTWGSGAR